MLGEASGSQGLGWGTRMRCRGPWGEGIVQSEVHGLWREGSGVGRRGSGLKALGCLVAWGCGGASTELCRAGLHQARRAVSPVVAIKHATLPTPCSPYAVARQVHVPVSVASHIPPLPPSPPPIRSGKYTFLSLFLAVTLEAFDTSDEGPPPTGFPPEAKPIKAPSKGRW